MKEVFQANDGTIFDNREKCEQYEKEKISDKDFPACADAFGDKVYFQEFFKLSEERKKQFLNEIYFIYTYECEKFFNLRSLCLTYDIDIPIPEHLSVICLYYDDDKEWKEFCDLEDKFYKLEKIFIGLS